MEDTWRGLNPSRQTTFSRAVCLLSFTQHTDSKRTGLHNTVSILAPRVPPCFLLEVWYRTARGHTVACVCVQVGGKLFRVPTTKVWTSCQVLSRTLGNLKIRTPAIGRRFYYNMMQKHVSGEGFKQKIVSSQIQKFVCVFWGCNRIYTQSCQS